MSGKIKGITVELGGDTTKLDKALKELGKESKNLDSQLRQINNSLKFNPGNTELMAQKQRVLAKKIENTKNKLNALKQAQKEAEVAFKNGEIGVQEYEKLQREILKTENQLKNLKKEQAEINNGWRDVGDKINQVSKKSETVGKTLTKGVTAPILGVGTAAIKAFTEVDEGLDTVIQKTGATGKVAQGLEQSFKNVYSNFPANSNEVGNAIGEVNTQFGFLGKELEEKTTLMLKFSQINGQDVTQSTIQSKQAIEAFNLSGKDLSLVLDSVTKTAQNTGVSTDKLFDSVVKGAPALQGMGLNFSQAVALMGQFEQSGVDSTKAMSYLTKAQANWAKEGKSMQDGLSELTNKIKGAKNEQEAIALSTEVFGTKAGPMMAKAIKDSKLNFDELAGAANLAKGSVNSTFEGTKDPIDDFTTAMNNLKIVGAELGTVIQEALGPVIQEIIAKIKEFTKWFSSLSQGQKEIIVKIALLAAALGPIVLAFSKLALGVGGVIKSIGNLSGAIIEVGGIFKFLSGTMTSIIGVMSTLLPIIVALVAAFLVGKLIYDHWGQIKQFFSETLNSIKELFSLIFTGISEFLSSIWDGIKLVTETIWNGIKEFFIAYFEFYKNLYISIFGVLKNIVTGAWQGIKLVTETIWNGIKDFFIAIFEFYKNLYTNIFNTLKNIVSTVWNTIKSITTGIWNGIKSVIISVLNAIRSVVSSSLNSVKNTFSNIFNGIRNLISNIFGSIKRIISSSLSDAVNTVFNFGRRFYEAGRNIIGSIVDGIKSAFSWVTDAIEDVVQSIRDFLPFSPAKKGPLRDLNKLNFGGTISEGIYKGKSIIQGAMSNALEVPLINFSGISADFSSLRNHTGTENISDNSIILNIKNMNVKNRDDAKYMAEELYRLSSREKRGLGF
ncbi:hypothetical protein HLB30_07460 [Peptostreptococcus russellii]|uniref:phage tail tape measure protein n=1 Tax=Peptostreptococcus russellii TaxID=215200 RepID=UPI001624F6EF|nr:phage tail tape measure protein [Peptostreptococcus russellii]MBC2578351.1 hypothetical protein [Peptostreptococcus russellii]